MSKITQFFHDDEGNLSSMRLIFILWAVGSLAIWGVVAVKTGTIPDIPSGILSVFGILTAGKVTQSFSENKK